MAIPITTPKANRCPKDIIARCHGAPSTQTSRPRGSVGIAALLCRSQTAGGGSISRWSASKSQDRQVL